MKQPLVIIVAILLTGCTPSVPDTQDQARALRIKAAALREEQLEDNYRPVGRFQFLSHGDRLLKLDTVTGATWEYSEARLINTNITEGWALAHGWEPIDNFSENASLILGLGTRPATNIFDDLIPKQ